MLKVFTYLFLLSFISVFAQQEEYITVIGDSLIGKVQNNEAIREVHGHVVLTQGDVVITCDKAIQFISSNDAQLIGNVIAKQDSLTIYTPEAFYYGNQRMAESSSGVKLDDQKVILTAKMGNYYFNEDRAFFQEDVVLYDTTATLTSNELTYWKEEDRMIAVGQVQIVDSENVIHADSLEYFRVDRITYADKNVSIRNLVNNVIIYGDHLEDYAMSYYTIIDENPLLVQVDTTFISAPDTLNGGQDTILTAHLDTLIIKSKVMEAYRDTVDMFEARDSVEIVREGFASKNSFTIYYQKDDKIVAFKPKAGMPQPIMWNERTQLTGDSIIVFLRENRIRLLDVNRNAFLLSQNEFYPDRFDQISGERVLMYFEEEGINRTEVFGNVLSIYYMYEEDTPNGLIKASAQSAAINFEEKKVSVVRLYKQPASEYYPENQVSGKERSFTLPQYVFYENRPTKEGLLRSISNTSSSAGPLE